MTLGGCKAAQSRESHFEEGNGWGPHMHSSNKMHPCSVAVSGTVTSLPPRAAGLRGRGQRLRRPVLTGEMGLSTGRLQIGLPLAQKN